ncbi:MAG: glycosyltransferase [Bacteroidaceae bacterium]|nr:glycosyltransferase [Bacteroidaceae bacterium]
MSDTTVIILFVNAVLWIPAIMLMIHYARLGAISRKQSNVDVSNNQPLPSAAIIIVAQEEAEKLRRHLPVFLEQKYPAEYQVIVVDIHSTDDTIKLLEQFEEQYPHLSHSSIPASARDISKQRLAMTLGVKTACTEWVIFTQADCCPEDEDWLANFMNIDANAKNAIIGFTKYTQCDSWLMRKRQFLRLRQQMLWIPFATNHHPYWADDTLLAYRRDYFFAHNGFASDSKLQAGAATLLVNKNISSKQCAISINQKSILLQDTPLPHTWLQERVFAIETHRHTTHKCLYRTWAALKTLLPLLFTISTVISCILWFQNTIVTSVLVALWLCTYIVRDIAFYRTTKQLNIKSYHFTLPYLCSILPLWNLQAWIRWCFTSKRAFRKKFV